MGTAALLMLLPLVAVAWPDGAPCVPTTFESMNPLEAIEHQGGLQLSEPPYELEVEQRCYWRGQPIALSLQGKNESIWFKGFAIQPLEYVGGGNGKRIGRLLRLDDNGSWQYQCFRFHDSATHSHNQRKKHMRMWWRNDDDESRTVQFVATVVHSQKRFWVKSVYSRPIPPCRQQRDFGPYTAPMPVPPPPVKGFKMDADREFGNFFINEAIPGTVERNDNQPTSSGSNPSPNFAFNFQQQQEQERQRQIERQRSEQRQREMERDRQNRERERQEQERQQRERERQRQEQEAARQRQEAERRARVQSERARIEQESRARAEQQRILQQQRPQQPQPLQQLPQRRPDARIRNQGTFSRTTSVVQQPASAAAPQRQQVSNNGVCADIDPPSRCIPWSQYCQASTYMHQYCRKTCHFC